MKAKKRPQRWNVYNILPYKKMDKLFMASRDEVFCTRCC